MTAGYRWHGVLGEGESQAARREQRRAEAVKRNEQAQPVYREACLHRHGRGSQYARTVCGVRT